MDYFQIVRVILDANSVSAGATIRLSCNMLKNTLSPSFWTQPFCLGKFRPKDHQSVGLGARQSDSTE
jgi:hypothetical protein